MTVASMILSVGAIWAQNVKVSGTVSDVNGEPLIGAYVLLQGTTTGTSTDVDGKYVIDAEACISCGACAGACPVDAPVEG